jgi:plasmid maintenance system killer protein
MVPMVSLERCMALPFQLENIEADGARFRALGADVARRKLIQLNNANDLGDLTVPPGNRFEALRGNLAGRYSIRINDQWRIVFRWDQRWTRGSRDQGLSLTRS